LFGNTEIGRLASDRHIGDEESHLGWKDGEFGWLDIDCEVGLGNFAADHLSGHFLHAGADPGSRLATFLIANKGVGDVTGQADSGLIEQVERR